VITKPMRAAKIKDVDALKYPLLATPKLDGIRSVYTAGKCLSKTFKPIPNHHVRNSIEAQCGALNLDFELVSYREDGQQKTFNEIQSDIMSRDGEPVFGALVFDYVTDLNMPYYKRMEALGALKLPSFCRKILPVVVNNLEELLALEENWLKQGYEGMMLRSFSSPYKCGQSTFKEHYLMKRKPLEDSECVVVGFVELMHNMNEAEEDAFGKTKRSSHKENLVPAGTLGKFLVREIGDTPWKGKDFAIGTGDGLDAKLRQKIWSNQEEYLGKIITYTYQAHGTKDLPRIPIWKGFRDREDISDVES
jgi:DNA ligase 1